jgi:Domain of unknown function (DUF4381)
MNNSDQLRDIHGLDPISWWPLAPGWWIIITLFLLTTLALTIFFYRRRLRKPPTDWRPAALAEWQTLQPGPLPNRQQVEQLGILIKRIAIQRYGRSHCAGLTGKPWLEWLTQHDPHGFDWMKTGRVLIELPYLPPDTKMDIDQVHTLYQVVRGWIEMK